MSLKIRRAAVLGAGVMGAQIAAHLAAAGVSTHLLDLASKDPPTDKNQARLLGKDFRSARAVLAVQNLKQLKPSPLYDADSLPKIIPGNFDDDLSVLASCDWIIEVVVERLDIKQGIHTKIAEYARPDVPVTTNTSGISLVNMVSHLPEEYQSRFFGTHFFNPPRYLHLVEMIPHPKTDRKLFDSLSQWIEERLGKGIVEAKDTVNFIANRVGIFASQIVFKHMKELGLNIETVDKLTGPLIGRSKSATFRTADVVGLDTFAAVARNTFDKAPDDPFREVFAMPPWVVQLIESGSLGQKTADVGCYKKTKDAQGKTAILAYRPDQQSYESQHPNTFPWEELTDKERDPVQRVRKILEHQDPGAQFIWRITRDLLLYASHLAPTIAGGEIRLIDQALRWGFNWDLGPFELWQALGVDAVMARIQKDEAKLPSWVKPGINFYDITPQTPEWLALGGPTKAFDSVKGQLVPVKTPPWAFRLPPFENRQDPRRVDSNKGASLLDLGDGVGCLVFHTKMNAIDFDIINMMKTAVTKASQHFDGLVIGNEGPAFSAGANLKMILESIRNQKWGDINQLIAEFQGVLQMVKFAPFPTVSTPFNLVLGGGCEVALHTTYRVAAGETYAGLVEIGVGLVPAGGGTKELALRAYQLAGFGEKADPMAFLQRAFLLIGMAKTSGSAQEAVSMGLFPQTTDVCLSTKHTLAQAKRKVLSLSRDGYTPKIPAHGIKVVGDPGIQTFKLALYNMVEGQQISPYDAVVGEKVATILCGGEIDGGSVVDEQWFLELERRTFLELCQQPKTAERIEYMLKNGKPLRN